MGKIQSQSLPQTFPFQFTTLSEDAASDLPFLPQGLGEQVVQVEFTVRKKKKTSNSFPVVTPSTITAMSQDIRGPDILRFCSKGPKMYFWWPELEINVIFPKKQFCFSHISGTLLAKLVMA